MKYLRFALPVVAAALVFASCAAKLPQADVDAANAAFNDAKTAQADVFAADSFKAASDANDALQANLNAKDYGKTKALAKALLDASTKAKADAATGVDAAKAEITKLSGTDLPAEITALKALVKKPAAKKAQDFKNLKAGVDGADKALKDAQALTDVAAADKALKDLKAQLDGFQSALDAAGVK